MKQTLCGLPGDRASMPQDHVTQEVKEMLEGSSWHLESSLYTIYFAFVVRGSPLAVDTGAWPWKPCVG